jgi:uncharacterized protein
MEGLAKRMRTLLRWLLLGLGILSVGLGVVGIFVPVLPTTPFLLLAAFCFARSSDRFLHWLLNNRWFGAYVRNYREQRGMALRDKVLTILALWMGIGVSGFLAVPSLGGRVALLLVAAAVTVHLTRIRTLRPTPVMPSPEPGRPTSPVPVDND